MRMKPIFPLLLTLCVAFTACQSRPGKQAADGVTDTIHYAKSIRIEPREGYTAVEIADPWDSAKAPVRYLLVPTADELPSGLPPGTVVRTPLKKIVVFTSVHCKMLSWLGVEREIAGVCEPRYISLPFVQEGIRAGRIADLGESTAPDMEKLIELSPDALFTSPVGGMGGYGKLDKMGIPIIECVDYMETHPLGRTEWIKLFGLLTGREAAADSLFRMTETTYNETKKLAAGVPERPKVLSELRTGGAWYVPGGESYMANLYRDAGAEFPWNDVARTGSVALSFEQVLERASDADRWLIKYNRPEEMTLADLKSDYAGYALFAPLGSGEVYGCNTGSNGYYEDLAVHPDRVLKDLVRVFHPDLLPDYAPRYFKKMNP